MLSSPEEKITKQEQRITKQNIHIDDLLKTIYFAGVCQFFFFFFARTAEYNRLKKNEKRSQRFVITTFIEVKMATILNSESKINNYKMFVLRFANSSQ